MKKILFAIFFSFLGLCVNAQAVDSLEEKIVFTQAEVEASFPGGTENWRKYIAKNLKPNVPVKNGAPIGIYTVVVRFIVSKEGLIKDIAAETNLGYGMEQEVIRVIKNGPKWIPAQQNGRMVNAYRMQPITFVVQDQAIDIVSEPALQSGTDNRVKVYVAKVKSEDVALVVSNGNGSVRPAEENTFILRPAKAGSVLVDIYIKKRFIRKKIGEAFFMVN